MTSLRCQGFFSSGRRIFAHIITRDWTAHGVIGGEKPDFRPSKLIFELNYEHEQKYKGL